MPICANPKKRRVKIPAGEGCVVLVLREYTASEYTRFMSNRLEFKKKGRMLDRSMQERIHFIDQLLEGIEAQDAQGKPDSVTYVDPASGQEKPLTPEVENWMVYVNPSWKIAAAMELEDVYGEVESVTVKN